MNCLGLYNSLVREGIPEYCKAVGSHWFPLDRQDSLHYPFVVFLTDEQGNVKVVESKVNQHPPRIMAYCSCPGQKTMKVFQIELNV